MNDWRKPCEHGHYGSHKQCTECQRLGGPGIDCPGGSPVTAADLASLLADVLPDLQIKEWKGWYDPKTGKPAHGMAHHPCDCEQWRPAAIEDLFPQVGQK